MRPVSVQPVSVQPVSVRPTQYRELVPNISFLEGRGRFLTE